MKLDEIFDQLSIGEFSQLSIGGAEAGVIDLTNHAAVLGHINLGLTTLFTRFNLKEKRYTLPLVADTYTYQLDLPELLKIEKVTTDDDFELDLNVDGATYGCLTPTMSSLQVSTDVVDQGPDLPDQLKTSNLIVVYRANHPKVAKQVSIFTPETVDIELPTSHLMPLLYFVASRAFNPVGMNNEFHAGNSYYAKYEAACQALEMKGMQVDQPTNNGRLCRNGWV